jgi:nicotinate-nucleotide pyrophosphorylase
MDDKNKNILIDNHVIYRQDIILVIKTISQYSWHTVKVDVKHQSINQSNMGISSRLAIITWILTIKSQTISH